MVNVEDALLIGNGLAQKTAHRTAGLALEPAGLGLGGERMVGFVRMAMHNAA